MNVQEGTFIGSRDEAEKAHCSPSTARLNTDRSQLELRGF